MNKYDPDTFHRCNACGMRISQTTECPGAATCLNNVKPATPTTMQAALSTARAALANTDERTQA